jgi:uncharacterized protein (DUF1800 family)
MPTSVAGRRALILGLAAGAVAAGAGTADQAEAATTDPVLHLLRRATYGPTPSLVAEVRKSGTTAWLEAQLAPAKIADPVMDGLLPRWPGRNWKTWEAREKLTPAQRGDYMYGTIEQHLARAIWSRRQLLELVVDLWTNHLVVPVPSSDVWDSAHLYQRDVIRKHALGRYQNLLTAATRHPALLQVLDNASSTKSRPNENHARELLELHTVGVGAYSEADVRDTARVLTGLSIDAESGMYEFKPWRHHVGKVSVLGWSHANDSAEGGEKVALSLLAYLAAHPATAKRVVTKLAVRFVADNPPAALVTRLAGVYSAQGTAIVPVLRALFTSAEFTASAGKKVRTPYEDAIATLRVAGVQPPKAGTEDFRKVLWTLRSLGQAPMGWPRPDGYPDVASAWASTSGTLRRWNLHLAVLAGWYLPTLTRPAPRALLPATLPTTYGGYLDALAQRLLVPPLSEAQRTAVCSYLEHAPGDRLKDTDAAVTWRLPNVAALILDSPNFATR